MTDINRHWIKAAYEDADDCMAYLRANNLADLVKGRVHPELADAALTIVTELDIVDPEAMRPEAEPSAATSHAWRQLHQAGAEMAAALARRYGANNVQGGETATVSIGDPLEGAHTVLAFTVGGRAMFWAEGAIGSEIEDRAREAN